VGALSVSQPYGPSWPGTEIALLHLHKVYYRVHKSPPLVSILSQMNLVDTKPSYLSKIHFTSIVPHVFLEVSFLVAFPQKPYTHSSSPPSVLHTLTITLSLTLSLFLIVPPKLNTSLKVETTWRESLLFLLRSILVFGKTAVSVT
jgi:hypothetical protein